MFKTAALSYGGLNSSFLLFVRLILLFNDEVELNVGKSGGVSGNVNVACKAPVCVKLIECVLLS